MVKVLIVDDTTMRAREIKGFLAGLSADIKSVTTLRDAEVEMIQNQYNLLILDIMLPKNDETIEITKSAGIELLQDIERLKRLKKPYHIIGVTSGYDTYNEIKNEFESRLIPLLLWDDPNICLTKIKKKIEYLIKVDKQTEKQNPIDFLVITAVEEEFASLHAQFSDWQVISIDNDATQYYKKTLIIEGMEKTLVLLKLPEMGMISASCITTKAIDIFSPQTVFMIGICGGVKGKVELTDLVIADKSWDYGSGKTNPLDDSNYSLESAPNQIPVSPYFISKIEREKDEIMREIIEEWNSRHSERDHINPKIHTAPMPSGASVVCDEKMIKAIIQPQHRKVVALDMETYGVYFATRHSSIPNINCVSIKSVSDFANSEKNDNYHEACCFISSKFLVKLIMRNFLDD